MYINDCKFFPCHKGMDDCLFCFCPIYPCQNETKGRWTPVNDVRFIWDCSDCTFFHKKENVDKIKKFMSNMIK